MTAPVLRKVGAFDPPTTHTKKETNYISVAKKVSQKLLTFDVLAANGDYTSSIRIAHHTNIQCIRPKIKSLPS